LNSFGDTFLALIQSYSRANALEIDAHTETVGEPIIAGPSMNARRAGPMFRAGASIDLVMQETGFARSTVCGYLCDYIRSEKPASIAAWVDEARVQEIAAAVAEHGSERLKPIFVALDERVSYDDIRIVVATLQASGGDV
jgi:ATP-dependent DNA helicase RecQ